MFGKSIALTLLALAHTALAGVYITSPVGTTSAIGGQVLNVQWADDGNSPTVSDIGICSIDLYTGSVNSQTFLQNLAASVDVSKASQISATIDPSIGQSGDYYFVKFIAATLKDTTNPQYPYQAFSAKFGIDKMTGTWNSTVLAEISGSVPVSAGPVATAASTAAASGASAAKSASASATTSSKAATGAASSTYTLSGSMVLLAGLASYLAL